MLRLLLLQLSVLLLTACAENTRDVNLQEKLKTDTTATAQQIIFAQPQIIDSSHVVIYPLILQDESRSNSYGSSSGGQQTSYWNLIFYNTETQNQTLLTKDKKILISSINLGSPSSSYSSDHPASNGINVYRDNIFYSVVSKDYDENKQLDENDPTYLFVSNRDGTNFRQISPDNYNIISWGIVTGSSKIIVQAQKDNNGDKVFNQEDETVPLFVDVRSNNIAVETFKNSFIDSLKNRLVNIWKQ